MEDTMTTENTDIHSAIRAAQDSFESTFGRGDAAGIANLYTENGELLPTGSDFVKGKQAIQEFWQGVLDMGIKNAKLDIVEVEQHGNSAVEVGQYTLSSADDQVMDKGKYIIIWRHDDSKWKLHYDIWNSSLPTA